MTALATVALASLALATVAAHGRDENGRRRTFKASVVAAFKAGAAA